MTGKLHIGINTIITRDDQDLGNYWALPNLASIHCSGTCEKL